MPRYKESELRFKDSPNDRRLVKVTARAAGIGKDSKKDELDPLSFQQDHGGRLYKRADHLSDDDLADVFDLMIHRLGGWGDHGERARLEVDGEVLKNHLNNRGNHDNDGGGDGTYDGRDNDDHHDGLGNGHDDGCDNGHDNRHDDSGNNSRDDDRNDGRSNGHDDACNNGRDDGDDVVALDRDRSQVSDLSSKAAVKTNPKLLRGQLRRHERPRWSNITGVHRPCTLGKLNQSR